MRLPLNRWIAAAAIAATAWMVGCSADSPTPTSNGPGGGNSGLAISLSATNTTPKSGTCTIVQAFATLNGAAVPDGSSIVLSTSFGIFAQNGLQSISLVTQSGGAAATVCSDAVGPVTVTGKVTLAGKTALKSLILQFTDNGLPPPGTPFISVCSNPHSGPVSGGTNVTISGGGFGTNIALVRVFFRSGAVVHQGVVTGVSDSTITVTTPAFPELNGLPATSVDVQVILGNGNVILDSPNCFTYVASNVFVSVCANPGSGPLTGGTTVDIHGGGFGNDPTAVQVQFRIGSVTQPAVVTNVTDSDISVLTPAFTGLNPTQANVADIIIKIGASTTITSPNCFTFTAVNIPPVVSSILPTSGTKLGGTRVTILGSGFSSPVQVFFGTVQGEIVSVNFSQIIAITPPLQGNAAPGAVAVVVKNAACGTGTTCQSNGATTFTYTAPLHITTFSPVHGDASTVVTILGEGFVAPLQVLFGSQEGTVVSVTGTQILVKPPAGCGVGGAITVTLIPTGESTTTSATFTGDAPTILSGPTPSSIAAGSSNVSVTITGTDLFPTGGGSSGVSVVNLSGGTVTVSSASEQNGTQTVILSVTPDSCSGSMTFALKNTQTGCTSGAVTISVNGGGAPTIASGPTPASGPAGQTTQVTITGTNLIVNGTTPTITSVSGGSVTLISASGAPGGTQTLVLNITPTAGCASSSVSFKIQTAQCTTQTLFFGSNGTAPSILSGPTPSTGTVGVTSNGVTLVGTNFFPPGNPSAATIVNITNGSTTSGVTITNRQDNTPSTGQQTLTLSITPDASIGCSGAVTFVVRNTAAPGGCQDTNLVSFGASTGGPVVTSGPTPSSGPSGTSINVTGTNFFRPGFPADATLVNVGGGTATITNRLSNGDGTETLVISVAATNTCTGGLVTFQIENTSLGGACKDSATLSFNASSQSGPVVTSGPTPNTGPNASITHTTVVGTSLFNPSNTAATTIVNKSPGGATVTIVGFFDNTPSAGQQTLNIDINPNGAACVPTTVTFQIQNATLSAGCRVSQLLTFTGTVATPVVATGPTPSNVPATATTNVVFTGSNLFPDGNPGLAQVCDPSGAPCGASVSVAGGTVSIFSTSGTNPSQTMTLAITPSGCTVTSISFKISNGSCQSGVLSVIVNGIRVDTGPVPSSGDAGVTTTDVTFTGVGFFPTGNPAAVAVINVANGTAIITSATEASGTQTVKLSITPNNCTNNVTFQLRNTATGCSTQQLSFIATEPAAQQPVASFSQVNGAAGTGQVTFQSTSTGPNTPFSCSWTFTGNNSGFPTPGSSLSCGPVLVTWDCGAGGTPCTNSPTAALTVTDACGGSNTHTEAVLPP